MLVIEKEEPTSGCLDELLQACVQQLIAIEHLARDRLRPVHTSGVTRGEVRSGNTHCEDDDAAEDRGRMLIL